MSRSHAFARRSRMGPVPTRAHQVPYRSSPRAHAQTVAIRAILGRSGVQPKLKIGRPNDALEQEADRVADQVMREGVVADVTPAGPARPHVQRLCAECEGDVQRQVEEEEELLQTKSKPDTGPAVTTDRSVLQGIGDGWPLAPAERGFFQSRFGRPLDDVRIHTGSAADRAATSINARAFTLGSDIAFAEGEYRPGASEGRKLLAHELTHVLQQRPRPLLKASSSASAGAESRPTVSFSPPVVRRQAPKPPGKRAFGSWVTTTDVKAKNFNNPDDFCDKSGVPIFDWAVDFDTSLDIGYIVQRIDNVFDAENCDETDFTGIVPTPLYWERWYVENNEIQTAKDSHYGAHDAWVRNLCQQLTGFMTGCHPYPQATRGNWSMTGTLYLLPGTGNPGGFVSGSVPDAGALQSTTTDPGDVLGRPKGTRTAYGSWDCCPREETPTPAPAPEPASTSTPTPTGTSANS